MENESGIISKSLLEERLAKLTNHQRRIYDYIKGFNHLDAVTIGSFIGVKSAGTYAILRRMIEAGVLYSPKKGMYKAWKSEIALPHSTEPTIPDKKDIDQEVTVEEAVTDNAPSPEAPVNEAPFEINWPLEYLRVTSRLLDILEKSAERESNYPELH